MYAVVVVIVVIAMVSNNVLQVNMQIFILGKQTHIASSR